MSCPACDCDAPALTRGGVSVCGDCGECYTADGKATMADLERLDAGDITELRRQRARVVPHRKKSQA